jgi:hypothetical protein
VADTKDTNKDVSGDGATDSKGKKKFFRLFSKRDKKRQVGSF